MSLTICNRRPRSALLQRGPFTARRMARNAFTRLPKRVLPPLGRAGLVARSCDPLGDPGGRDSKYRPTSATEPVGGNSP